MLETPRVELVSSGRKLLHAGELRQFLRVSAPRSVPDAPRTRARRKIGVSAPVHGARRGFRALESTARVARALRARSFHAAVSVLDARARCVRRARIVRLVVYSRRRGSTVVVGTSIRRARVSMRRVRARRARSPVRRRAVRASVLLLLSSRAPRRTTEQVSVRQVF